MTDAPRVSVLVAAYRSHRTVERSLRALDDQTYRDFEVIVTDSSPDDETREIVERFPDVRLVSSERRLLPQEARLLAARQARGSLFALTDPDIYASPGWLETLVEEHDRTGHSVVGTLACWGARRLDLGIHICKFGAWLPATPRGTVPFGLSGTWLLERSDIDLARGFGHPFLGDVSLSLDLRSRGRHIHVAPDALAHHHHLSSLSSFLRERRQRGRLFADLRLARPAAGRGAALGWLLVTALGPRLLRGAAILSGQAARSYGARTALLTAPIWMLGLLLSLLGEATTYAARTVGRSPATVTPSSPPPPPAPPDAPIGGSG